LKLDRIEEKQGKEKPGNPIDQAKLDQKLGCNPLTFVFLLKRYRFYF
jgi:hypothetical protein